MATLQELENRIIALEKERIDLLTNPITTLYLNENVNKNQIINDTSATSIQYVIENYPRAPIGTIILGGEFQQRRLIFCLTTTREWEVITTLP